MDIHVKTCTKCHRTRLVSEFYEDRHCTTGIYPHCKDCCRQAARARYYRKYDENRAKDRVRQRAPSYRAQNNRRKKEYVARNPERHRARHILNLAIKRGEVTRQPCSACGAPKAQGHHHDYSKPLDVSWLCQTCHGKEHRRSSEGLAHLKASGS